MSIRAYLVCKVEVRALSQPLCSREKGGKRKCKVTHIFYKPNKVRGTDGQRSREKDRETERKREREKKYSPRALSCFFFFTLITGKSERGKRRRNGTSNEAATCPFFIRSRVRSRIRAVKVRRIVY